VTTELPSGITNSSTVSYIPQLGRALQTEPVVPPGSSPSGTFTAAPYTVPYEAWIGTSAAAWGAAAPEREAARQAALQREAEEAAARARANQPPEAIPTPEEGAGQETFGDPVHCYVGGTPMIGEESLGVAGYGGCNQGLPQGTWLYVCAGAYSDSGGPPVKRCNHFTVRHHTSRYWSKGTGAAIHCEPGDILKALVEFYVPGGKVLYAGTENGGECGGGTDSIDEAALSLFGDPSTSSALQLLLSFFGGG
jgi:hypothetical protein